MNVLALIKPLDACLPGFQGVAAATISVRFV
jgi:hypothetical protein